MKHRVYITLFLSTLALLVQGCMGFAVIPGSGTVVEQTRPVSDFSGVALAGIGILHIEMGDVESLRIQAERYLMPYLETHVRDGQLRIGVRDNVLLRNTRPIHFYLTAVHLEAIELSGSGEVRAPNMAADTFTVGVSGSGQIATGDLDAERVQVKISGSGDAQIGRVRADTLNVYLSGSGDLKIAGGEVAAQRVTISGSGRYTAWRLDSVEARARISGSGAATIRVSEHLDAHVSGSGDVHYLGRPVIDSTVTGAGDVRHIDG
jgi:hypothetical protein